MLPLWRLLLLRLRLRLLLLFRCALLRGRRFLVPLRQIFSTPGPENATFNFRLAVVTTCRRVPAKPYSQYSSRPSTIRLSSKSTTAVGFVIAVLIVGAIGSIAYYQFEVAPSQNNTSSTTTTTSPPAVTCKGTNCAYVNITAGASGCTNPSSPCGFDPATLTVVIGVNNTVMWTNQDQAVHTVTGSNWGSSEAPGISPGGNFTYTFATAGSYQYHCIYHSGMIGTVVVKNS